MLLRDLSSAITQQCSRKIMANTPDEYLYYINKNQFIECPSVTKEDSTVPFHVCLEQIEVGCVNIYQHHTHSSYSISNKKDSKDYACVILPSIQGRSRLLSEGKEHDINEKFGLIMSNCNADIEYILEKNSVHIMVIIPTKLIETTYNRLTGYYTNSGIKFSPTIEGRFSPWIQILSTAVYGSGISRHYDSIKNSLEHLITSGLLLTYLNNYSNKFEQQNRIYPPRTVRSAINYMEQHLNDPITISAVAAHAGVGIRALQLSFRKYMGMSPGEWLCDRRLDRAHAMLMEEDTTVTQAALTWGFYDLSNFSARYQKRYGRLPSKTLLRR